MAAAVPVSNAKHVRFGQGRRRERGRESVEGGQGGRESGRQRAWQKNRWAGGRAGQVWGVCILLRASVYALAVQVWWLDGAGQGGWARTSSFAPVANRPEDVDVKATAGKRTPLKATRPWHCCKGSAAAGIHA